MRFLRVVITNPRWAMACFKAAARLVNGQSTEVEFENALKLAQRRYGVNWHRFDE